MPEVHGKGLNKANIRDTYQQEVLEGQQNAAAATKAAQQIIAEKITRESKAKQDIYGEVLGNMYDGDRDAILKYRDHIRQEFLDGTYSSDPSMYQTRIANLNSMIENAENFYKTTYGDDSADGTGNTYRDIQIRHERGNSVEFWEEQGLEMKGDEWMEAQQRLQELQGGMYRDLQFTPDGNVMARSVNPETGEMGELMGFENLPQREIGAQNFMPDTQILSPASMFDLAGEQDVQLRLRQLYQGLLEESGEVMYNGKLTNVNNMNALDKMNYMSDMYFDDNVMKGLNNSEARKFRRSLASELPLDKEQTKAFIEGDIEALTSTNGGQAALKEARRHWREVTRQAFVKPGTSRRPGGGTKVEDPDYISNRYNFNLQDISEEDRLLAGIMGPFDFEEISGDGLEDPIEIQASTAFQSEGIPTESANYKIFGAAFHTIPAQKASAMPGVQPGMQGSAEKGIFIARVQIPELVTETNPETGEVSEKVVNVTKNVIVSPQSVGWRKEIYNNLLNNSSDLAMAMSSRAASFYDRVGDDLDLARPE